VITPRIRIFFRNGERPSSLAKLWHTGPAEQFRYISPNFCRWRHAQFKVNVRYMYNSGGARLLSNGFRLSLVVSLNDTDDSITPKFTPQVFQTLLSAG
jgi:hypothetical protein